MTDIWRSFVAQRCLWELKAGLVFHEADAVQERNEHDYMQDFHSEVPGYLNNSKIAALLSALELETGPDKVGRNLLCCYEELVKHEVLPPEELELVHAWLEDISR